MENWTTKYYTISDGKETVSMPIICKKTDQYAVVVFKSKRGFGKFASYKNAYGHSSQKVAKTTLEPNSGIYHLHLRRTKKDDLVYRP